jgi:hypothetical protein
MDFESLSQDDKVSGRKEGRKERRKEGGRER